MVRMLFVPVPVGGKCDKDSLLPFVVGGEVIGGVGESICREGTKSEDAFISG